MATSKTMLGAQTAAKSNPYLLFCITLFSLSLVLNTKSAVADLQLPRPDKVFTVSEHTNKAWNPEDADRLVQPYVDDILDDLPEGRELAIDWQMLGLLTVTSEQLKEWQTTTLVQNAVIVTSVQVQLTILAEAIYRTVDDKRGRRKRAAFAEPLDRFQRIFVTAAPDEDYWKHDHQLQAAWIDEDTSQLTIKLRRLRWATMRWQEGDESGDEITPNTGILISPGLPGFYPTYYAVVGEAELWLLINPLHIYYMVVPRITAPGLAYGNHFSTDQHNGRWLFPRQFVISGLNTRGACRRIAAFGLIEISTWFGLNREVVDPPHIRYATLRAEIHDNEDGSRTAKLTLTCFFRGALLGVKPNEGVVSTTALYQRQFKALDIGFAVDGTTGHLLLVPPTVIPTNDPLFYLLPPGQNLRFIVKLDGSKSVKKARQGRGYHLFFEVESKDGQQRIRWRG